SYLDAVTGLSGSGPAYIYLIIEALTSGGVWAGLPKPIAQQLAVQTVKGTVAMIEKNPDKAIEDLRHAVTSPGGTTIAGLAALERHGVRNAIMEAVKDAADRSAELGKR
ncbi:MAG: pyrroline-5-carboxylate reductase, partial [Spirochaetales bacterium]|nr:pyrroline-5-carboxylate reductase [Spirochaetales bacterium]